MKLDLEEQLTAGMAQRVAGVAFSRDVLAAAQRRYRRGVALRRGLVGAAGLLVAGALAGLLAINVAGAGSDPTGTTTKDRPTATDTPQLQLAGALTASQQVSYRVRVSSTANPGTVATVEGAYDPASRTGYANSSWSGAPGLVSYQRIIDGVEFVGATGATWKQNPGIVGRPRFDHNLGDAIAASVDPLQLLDQLRGVGAKVTRRGSHAYHFEHSMDRSAEVAGKKKGLTGLWESYVGDVAVGDDNRITMVSYTREVRSEANGTISSHSSQVTVEFSGYGEPVHVERPTDVIVAR